MSIVEFLLARIAEDEADARKLAATDRRPVLSLATTVNHSERLLLECEAKRRIVEAHRRQVEDDDPCAWIVASETLLHTLAAVYADHPDYDPAWRV